MPQQTPTSNAKPATSPSARDGVVVLDYDGTLVPFAATPAMAAPDVELRDLLGELALRYHVHVLSGRGRDWLDAWFDGVPVDLYAEHGFWSRSSGASWRQLCPMTPDLTPWLSTFENLVDRTPGTFLERKTVSLAWHYRTAKSTVTARWLRELDAQLRESLPESLELVNGAKAIELKPRAARKGPIARALVEAACADRARPGIVIAGDGRDDEEMFAVAPRSAMTIHVGGGATRARCCVAGTAQLRSILRQLP
jgi:trehalose 6-phosphate synthase/phosphatase